LFVEKTWSLLGLSRWKLVAASAAGMAVIGAKIDLFFGGTTWGTAAAVGGAMGAGSAFFGSRSASGLTVKLPYFSRAIAGTELTIGPIKHQNFPWIVLDRAIGVFLNVSKRAHARQDKEILDSKKLLERLRTEKANADQAPDLLRKALSKAFSEIRNGRFDNDKREVAVASLREWLRTISEIDPATR
jgi:hypothetical protein